MARQVYADNVDANGNVELELIGNVCKTYSGTEYYELNQYCFGNSVDAMNTIN